MNAKKFLAACTAAVLTLGFSLGASSVAFADEAVDETAEITVEEQVEENVEEQVEVLTEESSDTSEPSTFAVVSTFVAPVAHDSNHVQGGPHPDGGANKITICHATPPDTAAQGWNSLSPDDDAVATNQAGHASEHDMDIIPAFEYWLNTGNGNGQNSNWIKLTYPGKNLTTDFGGVTGAQILANGCEKPVVPVPDPTCVVVVWEMPSWIGGQTPSWPQTLVAVHDADCTTPISEDDIPVPDLCGTQYQLDKYFESEITTDLIEGAELYGPNDPEEDLVPGGWNVAYMLVNNPDCPVATAAVTVTERDCFVATTMQADDGESDNVTWGDPVIDDVEGTISITATAVGDALFEDGLDGVSDDRTTRTFTAPYEPAGGDDCILPAIGVVVDSSPITCDTDGWFEFGPGEGVSDADAALLVWTVGPVAYADADEPGVKHSVTEPATITVTVSLVDSAQGDYALSDESGDGEVDPETGAITFTFEFTAADDCELGAVVVPEVTWVDECVEELRLDLAAAALVGAASFTVTNSPNVSYSYTINGGAPTDVVFPDGVDDVTILVTPGDTVVVTATAADGFQLPDGYEPFVKEFVESEFCLDLETGPATTAAVEFTLGECEGDSSVELTDEGGVVWRINGVIVAGNTSHALAAGSEVEVTASLADPSEEFPLGWTWSDPEQETSWEQTVAASDPNCDPELASTGLSSLAEQVGLLAVLLTLAGMALVARKHRVITA